MLPRVVKGNEDSSIYSALPLVKTNDPYIEKLIAFGKSEVSFASQCVFTTLPLG